MTTTRTGGLVPSVRFKGFLIMKKDRLEIAVHEAGHAVFRLLIYGSPGRCAVFSEKVGGACGICCGKGDNPEQAAREVVDNERDFSHLKGDLRACLDAAGLALSGGAAVALARGTAHLLPTSGSGNQKDVEHAAEVARLAFSENDGLLVDGFRLLAFRHACAVLSRRMDAVLAIGARLAEKGELSETEIGALYADAISKKKETEVQQ